MTPASRDGDAPSIRARAPQEALGLLDVFKPGLRDRVLRRLPQRSAAAIQQADRDEFIAIEHDRHLPAAIVAELGSEAPAFFSLVVTRHLENSLFRSLLATATKLFGMTPAGLLRTFPVAWRVVYRGFCDPVVTVDGPGRAQVRFERAAPEVLAAKAYAISFEGIVAGVLGLADTTGTVDTAVSIRERTITCDVRWDAASPGR